MPVNVVSKWNVQVKKQQDSRLSVYEPILGRWAGRLGDQSGNVQNPAYPTGYVFVRDLAGNIMTMWNEHAPLTWDLPVVYGYDGTEPKLLQVLYQWTTYQQQPFLTLPPHRETHVFPANDWVPVRSEMIIPGGVLVKSGYTVTVYPLCYPSDLGGFTSSSQQDVDLTSHVPASTGALLVLVALHDDGTVVLTDGATNTTGPEGLSMADIPLPSYLGDVPLAAVRLFFGQSSIKQSASYSDIFDLRFLAGRLGAGGWGTSAVTLAAAVTTFAVKNRTMIMTGDAGGNTIGTITGGAPGMELVLIFTDNKITITDTGTGAANTTNLSAAFTSAANTTLKLVSNGTSWFETSRSVN